MGHWRSVGLKSSSSACEVCGPPLLSYSNPISSAFIFTLSCIISPRVLASYLDVLLRLQVPHTADSNLTELATVVDNEHVSTGLSSSPFKTAIDTTQVML